MYYSSRGSNLGFSLLPPRGVRQAISNVFNAAVGAGERAATQRLQAVAPAPSANPVEQAIAQVPGGIPTIAVVAALGLGAMFLFSRRH
jgi:hypothetical protein